MSQNTTPTTPPSTEALAEARRMALESEAAGNSTLPDNAPPQAGDPAATSGNAVVDERHAREAAVRPQKSSADLAREAIGARYRETRGQNPDSSELAISEGVTRMMAEAEGRPIEQTQPSDSAAIPRRAAPAPAASTGSDQPLAKPNDTVTILVEGRQVAVPASEIWRHGVAAAQKQSTADARLQRVTEAERALTIERQALDARAAEIERTRAATPTGGAPASTSTASPPSGGRPSVETTKKALSALLDGDVDGAAQALDQFVTEQVDAKQAAARASAPPAATPQSASVHPARLEEPWTVAQREEANAEFLRTHPDIAYNPELMAVAVQRMRVEMDNPANRAAKVDLGRIVLRIGSEMTRDLPSRGAPAPDSNPTPQPRANTGDELAARRQLAARVPGIPPSATARTVIAASTGSAPPTRSDAVQAMRRSRGQPV